MEVTRIGDGPIIHSELCDSIGTNIQGPSLIRMPDWAPNALGRFHLYFADHKGGHIRLAYADELEGPWTVHRPGSLQLADSCFLTEQPTVTDEALAEAHERWRQAFGGDYSIDEVMVDATTPHIASPDVHIDHEMRRFVMYFHGLESFGRQVTRAATSTDGVNFVAHPEVLGGSYFRSFRYRDWWYALAMPGWVLRSRDGLTGFEHGPRLFEPDMRHSAVWVDGDTLHVWWSRVGDRPESILHSTVDLSGDWRTWRDGEPELVLAPDRPWEGSEQPVEPSRRGAVHGLVRQLRDPAIFVDDDRAWLLYAGGGESNICLASVTGLIDPPG